MLLKINIKVVINFCWHAISSLETAYVAIWDAKKLWLSNGDVKMKTHKMKVNIDTLQTAAV